ncbi:MAG: arginine--tRNA ligase [bacterium]|nr:arginine--tRNA ligase [bacterium]
MKEVLEKLITQAIGQKADFDLTAPDKSDFGDYATNVAFVLSKADGRSPLSIAQELVEKIKSTDNGKVINKAEAVAPGFINFWLNPEILLQELADILDQKNKYGRFKTATPQKIQVEFVSANPTGPLTMANGRGGFLGATLANVLEAAGNKVVREFYINDAGNQVKLLGESVLAIIESTELKDEYYKGDYIKKLADKFKNKAGRIKKTGGRIVADYLLRRHLKPSLKNAGIKFDNWFSEYRNLHKKGELQKVLEFLEDKGLAIEHDGATWLKTSDIADEKDRVLVKSDGSPTYFLADVAYHYDKFIKRKFDKVIDIWGADHHGYVARLKAGAKTIGADPEKLEIILVQLVRLMKDGQESRMSKRAGQFITLDELLNEVGKDAARFHFLMYAPETHMDFDLELAKEKSLKNPVYYVQYAYVRALGVLSKGSGSIANHAGLKELSSDSELRLIKELIKWPDILRQTTEDYQINRLPRHAIDISRAFHNFYEHERVVCVDPAIMKARLALVSATKIVLENVLNILGVDLPKKM